METRKSTYNLSLTAFLGLKVRAYFKLLKFRLSFLVVISAVFGFQMAPGIVSWDWVTLLLLGLGGFMVTGASNILNQVFEIEQDSLMSRTNKRPLPVGDVQPLESVIYALLIGAGGVAILAVSFNLTAALLGVIAFLSYAFVYTPMKRKSPIGVLIGAIPGAMPPLIGWAAATGGLETGAWILFLIQFIWQFPHFWAIAWVLDADYSKAGFKMLPTPSGHSSTNATIILIYTFLLIPVCFLPWNTGMTGIVAIAVMVAAGLGMTMQSFMLLKRKDNKSAKKLMYYSFIYLPVVQAAMLIDKF
ncbi:MAG: protoheme IX farnesyltransferase [Bacteroidia bacterium]|nr:protoheme IX farnesyltransferase [Bacteroidia bacterium]